MSYYFSNDETVKSEIKKIDIKLDIMLSFYTDNGVFSKKGMDFGTRTLVNSLPTLQGSVLDIGCGYGPIGIYISKRDGLKVDMIDINKRCVDLSSKNAILNNVDVNVFHSNGFENINKKYDFIVSNPPIRIGKKNMYELLFGAKKYLNKSGELWIVVNKNQGAKSLVTDLSSEYEVNVVLKNKGFYVIRAINN